MNEIKTNIYTEMIDSYRKKVESNEKILEKLLQERPLNFENVFKIIQRIIMDKSMIERFVASSEGRMFQDISLSYNKIKEEIYEKYHMRDLSQKELLHENLVHNLNRYKERLEINENKLEDISQKKQLDLGRVYNLINLIARYKTAIDSVSREVSEDYLEKIRKELCNKYHVKYTPHKRCNLPFLPPLIMEKKKEKYIDDSSKWLMPIGILTLRDFFRLFT